MPIVTTPDDLRYVETSALLAAFLEADPAARRAFRGASLITSALTFAEAGRAVMRARKSGRLTPVQERSVLRALARFRSRCMVMAVTDDVLADVSRPFPVEPLRTLDAIHLATATQLADTPQLLAIVTRDHRIRANALALGHPVL